MKNVFESEVEFYQHVVRFETDGYVCWCGEDDPEREPIHLVKAGDLVWIMDWYEDDNGHYHHCYGGMGPSAKVETNAKMSLVFATDDTEMLFNYHEDIRMEISPDYT